MVYSYQSDLYVFYFYRSWIHYKFMTTLILDGELTHYGQMNFGDRKAAGIIGKTGCQKKGWKEL